MSKFIKSFTESVYQPQNTKAYVKLFTTIELFLEIGGTIEELPDGPKEYYLLIEELKKPASDTDTEEVKKIKDFINNYNKNGA